MVWSKRPDMVIHEDEPFNAESPAAALAGRPITDIDGFYSRNHGPIPDVDPERWRLTVDGLVTSPLSLSLADLRASFERREVVATLQCAGNRRADLMAVRDIPGEAPWGGGATSTARWAGAALGEVLRAAGLADGAAHVGFEAPDVSSLAEPPQAYGGSIARHKALAPEVLLAWELNGEPLPRLHGGPVRVVVPGYIGARSVKWVERVTALVTPSTNWFQATAYRLLPAEADPGRAGPGDGMPLGAVAVTSDILRPADGDRVGAGPVTVSGYALAGDDRGVARVDVSVDGGTTWQQAELGEELGPWAWRLWTTDVHVPAGPAEIVARAWDTAAASQPEHARHLWNPKGYVNNAWARVRVTGG
jgi:sulfite oxidase